MYRTYATKHDIWYLKNKKSLNYLHASNSTFKQYAIILLFSSLILLGLHIFNLFKHRNLQPKPPRWLFRSMWGTHPVSQTIATPKARENLEFKEVGQVQKWALFS